MNVPTERPTLTIKVLLIGDVHVGKNSIMFMLNNNNDSIDLKIRNIEEDGMKMKLQIWDKVGQERFPTLPTAYYRGANGIMLVYDITNEKSFDNIRNWIQNIEEHASWDVEKMILGNKCDMNDKRQVSKEKGEQLAIKHGITFMETSAEASINVEEAFLTLARDIKDKMDSSSPPKGGGGQKLTSSQNQPKKSWWKCAIL